MRKKTKKAILDTAEALFAERGYKQTSLRSITARAGVNLAAVNYHFGSKKALLEAVFSRRLDPLNDERLTKLRQIEEKCAGRGRIPATAEVLEAFILPVVNFRQSAAGGAPIGILIGRALTEPDAVVRDIFVKKMRPVFTLSFRLLRDSLPHLAPEQVFVRFNLALGAMSRGMCLAEDAPLLPDGLPALPSTAEISSSLLSFVTSGMEAEQR